MLFIFLAFSNPEKTIKARVKIIIIGIMMFIYNGPDNVIIEKSKIPCKAVAMNMPVAKIVFFHFASRKEITSEYPITAAQRVCKKTAPIDLTRSMTRASLSGMVPRVGNI